MIKDIISKIKYRKSGIQKNSLEGDVELIILTEKILPDMKNSLRDRGLPVTDIYNNIEDAKIGLLLRSNACRVVIIERGLGVFNTTTMRVELTDLLGMCDGKSKKATVFYTDDLLKSDNIKITKANNLDWKLYKGTVNIINEIKRYNEDYIDKNNRDEVKLINGLEFKGTLVEDKVKTDIICKIDVNENNDILLNTYNGVGDALPVYEVRY